MKKIGTVLCRLGLHAFESDPSEKELLRATGLNIVFWSEAIQRAARQCARGCGAKQRVYRVGLCGIGGTSGKWQKLDNETSQYIDSLKVL